MKIGPVITNIKGGKGDSVRAPRLFGNDLIIDRVVTSAVTGDEIVTPMNLGHVRGPQGLPGVNAVENDAAVASYISTLGASETKAALERAYGGAGVSLAVHGPVGDGVTDDSAALSAALSDAASRGLSSVMIPNGIFAVQSIDVPAGMSLVGPGTLKWHTGSPAGVPFVTLHAGSGVANVTLDGNRGANARTNHRSQDAIVYVAADGDGASVVGSRLINGPSSAVWGEAGARHVRVSDNSMRGMTNYNVAVRGHGWIVTGNTMMGGTNGVRVGSWLSEFQANPGMQLFHGAVISSNVIYGTQSVPFEVEINAHGTVITGNSVYFCNGVTKIQYQPSEPVYNTVFANNTFYKCGHQVTYDDATGVATQRLDLPMIAPVPFGGLDTIVTGNVVQDVAGVVVQHGTRFTNNTLLDIGAETSGRSAIQVAATTNLTIVHGNRLRLKEGRQIESLVRVDAANARITGNDFTGLSGVANLVRVLADGCIVQGNVFRDSGGSMNVGSNRSRAQVRDNVFSGVSAPFAGINRLSGTLIQGNSGGEAVPDMVTVANVSGGAVAVSGARKMSIGSGTDGVAATLTTITGGQPGDTIVLQRNSTQQAITVASGGNITLTGSAYALDAGKKIVLVFDGTAWLETART